MYVPLDPLLPQAQLTYKLEDSQAALIVTNERHRSQANAWAHEALHALHIENIEGRPRPSALT